jgi:hypothetical protein
MPEPLWDVVARINPPIAPDHILADAYASVEQVAPQLIAEGQRLHPTDPRAAKDWTLREAVNFRDMLVGRAK